MSRYAIVEVRLEIDSNDEKSITETLENMDWDFTAAPDTAKIIDMDIVDWEIKPDVF